MLNKKTFQDLSYPLLLDTLLRRCLGRPGPRVGDLLSSWASRLGPRTRFESSFILPGCNCQQWCQAAFVHFTATQAIAKKRAEISWDTNTTEMRYCISNVGSCQCYSKISPNLQRYLNKLLAFDFTWKNPTKKNDSKHLCDHKKGKVCGWGWMMSWLLGSAANSGPLHLTSWPSWPSCLKYPNMSFVSIASGMCQKIKSGDCRSLQRKKHKVNIDMLQYKVTSMRQIRKKNSLSVRMPIMSKWPILHLLLLLVQQTLQPQRHTVGTKPWDKSYKSKNYFLTM